MQAVTHAMMEQAARNLCAIRRIDPDEILTVPGAEGGTPTPAWKLFEPEIMHFLELQQAIMTGFNNQAPDGTPLRPGIILANGQHH